MAESEPRAEAPTDNITQVSPGHITNTVTIGGLSTSNGPAKPTRKRRRVVISCTACHRRKQRCDRGLPCSNCVARHVESTCVYESQSIATNIDAKKSSSGGIRRRSGDDSPWEMRNDSETLSAFGYSDAVLGIYKRIVIPGREVDIVSSNSVPQKDDRLCEKYKSLIRQLPARIYVDKLVVTFFREVNWQYSFLERTSFNENLQCWDKLSFEALNKGPQTLPKGIRFFPGLLFQVLALALQFQPLDHDSSLDSLKHVSSMSVDDLAHDYSESGLAILTLLGKRDLTLDALHIGLLRTTFLKNSGLIIESWHCLGQTIRDAQECGLHKDSPSTVADPPEQAVDAIWVKEQRSRMWNYLSLWDLHMSLVLGRPHTIDFQDMPSTLPIDAPYPKNIHETAPYPRSEIDPPTPLTMSIISAERLSIFKQIKMLEKEGPHPCDYSKVERVHEECLRQIEQLPPFFRAENPDTTFDQLPDCYWLERARPFIDAVARFAIMVLHRPYVFTITKSRSEALKAALQILRAQRRLFQYLQAHHYKMFNLVLSTFDAVVLVAAIYIVYPNEHPDRLDDALQHFAWALERFETMSVRNTMARAALGVLQAIHVRLLRSLETRDRNEHSTRAQPDRVLPISSTIPIDASTNSSSFQGGKIIQGSSISGNSEYPGITGGVPKNIKSAQDIVHSNSTPNVEIGFETGHIDGTKISGSQANINPSNEDWGAYNNLLIPSFDGSNFDFSAMAPLQPIHDLLYNDLSGMTPTLGSTTATQPQTIYDPTMSWQFEGGFANDSFWSLMNQYSP